MPKRPARGAAGTWSPSTKYTGDFDGMIKRRRIRVLVPFSKTHYFVDKGEQRGLAYDAFTLFEEELNKKLKKGNSVRPRRVRAVARGRPASRP